MSGTGATLTDHQALAALEGVLAQAVIPCPFAQAKALITIIGAGLVERDGFRDQLAAKDAADAAPAGDPDVRTVPFRTADTQTAVTGPDRG